MINSCSKCGNTDLLVRYIPRGQLIDHSSRYKVDNEFCYSNEYDFYWQVKSAKEHLTKHCRSCQFGWRENVVSGQELAK